MNIVQMAMKVYGLKATVLRCNKLTVEIGERGFLVEYIVSSMLRIRRFTSVAPNHERDSHVG